MTINELPIYLPWRLIKRYDKRKTEEELKEMRWYEKHMYECNYKRHHGLEGRCKFAHHHLTKSLQNKVSYSAAYKLKYPKSPNCDRDLSIFFSYIGVEEKLSCAQIAKKYKLSRTGRANQLFFVMMSRFFRYVNSYPSILKDFEKEQTDPKDAA